VSSTDDTLKQEFEQKQHYSAADLHFLDFYQLLSFGYQSSIVIPEEVLKYRFNK